MLQQEVHKWHQLAATANQEQLTAKAQHSMELAASRQAGRQHRASRTHMPMTAASL